MDAIKRGHNGMQEIYKRELINDIIMSRQGGLNLTILTILNCNNTSEDNNNNLIDFQLSLL